MTDSLLCKEFMPSPDEFESLYGKFMFQRSDATRSLFLAIADVILLPSKEESTALLVRDGNVEECFPSCYGGDIWNAFEIKKCARIKHAAARDAPKVKMLLNTFFQGWSSWRKDVADELVHMGFSVP